MHLTPFPQCAIPVFEGLLPSPHKEIVLDLLFELATWHAFAKLCLHTDTTMEAFDTSTTTLGQYLCKFTTKTCTAFRTKELPREEATRGRQKAAEAAKKTGKGARTALKPAQTQAKVKLFNLSTYKLHALGDYVKTIPLFGTSDSYSTGYSHPMTQVSIFIYKH